MKKIILPAVIVVFFTFCFTACRMNVLKGTGTRTTNDIIVSPFNVVVVDVPVKVVVNVVAGAAPALQLSGFENLQQHIKTRVENATLHIYSDLDATWTMERDGVTAQITMPEIAALTLNGSNNADIHGPMKGASFSADISGAGNMNIDEAIVDSFSVTLSGAGNLLVKGGHVKYAEFEIDGAGDMRAFSLQANEATATINGAGSIEVNAVEKLAADISGAGSVKYKGSPHITRDLAGAGSVSKAD